MKQTDVVTIEPCIEEAADLVASLKARLASQQQRKMRSVFTSLAGDDRAVGLLAFYIWRRRARQQV